jgi:putative spermidine/putrescine transport system substrate-binding protein
MTDPVGPITRRTMLTGIGAATVAVGTPAQAASSLAGSGSVNVYDGGGSWGAAQKAAYFDPFEKETGIKVVRVPVYPTGRIRAGIQAGAPPYDVFHIGGATLPTFAHEGLLLPIDYSLCDPVDLAAFAPAKPTKFGLPALYGSLILSYDVASITSPGPASWADFWDTKRFPGPRSLNVGSTGPTGATFEVALLADGVPFEKIYPIDWDRAFRSLERIKPNVPKFWTGWGEGVQLLIDRSVTLSSTWNGRISDAQAQGAKLAMSWDQGVLQGGSWAVPKGAANSENAFKFIAFAARAERQAAFADLITYAPTNTRAYDLIKPERLPLLPTAPVNRDRQLVQNFDWWASEDRPGITNEALAVKLWESWVTKS